MSQELILVIDQISKEKGIFSHPLPEGKDKMFRRFLLNALAGKNSSELQEISFMLTKICLLAREAAEKGKIIDLK